MSKHERQAERLEKLLTSLEAMGLDDYLKKRSDPRRMFWSSLGLGIARGLGAAIGFSVLGAVAIYILRNIAMANLPVIGDFIARIVNIVDGKLG